MGFDASETAALLKRPDPARMAAGVFWGTLLLGAGIWILPHGRQALRFGRLVGAEPPARLPVPVEGVGQEDLSDAWGDPRSGGRIHQGIDIFASRGTPVRSATAGIVVRRGENPLGGRTVTILGPGGWRHYYAHLQQYGGQSEGEWVAAGEVIGFVGTSGNAPADAPHLHYGIYTGSGPTNPFPLLVPGGPPPDARR
ncbi:M23 family metallopeptidase [soil metagenome]